MCNRSLLYFKFLIFYSSIDLELQIFCIKFIKLLFDNDFCGYCTIMFILYYKLMMVDKWKNIADRSDDCKY